MLTYLNGPRRPIFKKAQAQKPAPKAPAALKKSGVIKKLLKASPPALVIKAVKRAPMVRAQVKQHKALQPIQRKSPLTVSRIKKAAIEQHRRQVFQDQGEPAMLEPTPTQAPTPTPQTEQEVDQLFNEFESQEDESPEYFDQEGEQEDESAEDLGIYYPGMGKLFKKKSKDPAPSKTEKKAQKPKQVRKTLKVESKAKARTDRAARPRGEGFSKLVEAGTKILDKTLNKGGTEADLQVPEVREAGAFSISSIPAPVKYIGLAALAYGGYKFLTKKN